MTTGQRAARLLIFVMWGGLALLAAAAMLEGYLKVRSDWARRHAPAQMPNYARLADAYHPFAVQHLNPFSLFFFPLDPADRLALNDDICSIDENGFRGPGPELTGERELAFLVGGSSAFGYLCSGDDTTITGYLNRIQSRYFFVNAGVPSWNSFQEFTRLSQQLLDYSPALVVAYDGGNDAALAFDYWTHGFNYPAGTPESFDALSALVGDIRGDRLYRAGKPIYARLFPRLTRSIEIRVRRRWPGRADVRTQRNGQAPPDEVMIDAADRYVANLAHMQALTEASGARFVAVFQPIGRLDDSAPEYERSKLRTGPYRVFRDRAFSQPAPLREHLDYSTVFESYPRETVWRKQPGHEDLDDEVIFVDGFHLYDPGNRFVAERMINDFLAADSPPTMEAPPMNQQSVSLPLTPRPKS